MHPNTAKFFGSIFASVVLAVMVLVFAYYAHLSAPGQGFGFGVLAFLSFLALCGSLTAASTGYNKFN